MNFTTAKIIVLTALIENSITFARFMLWSQGDLLLRV